MTWSALSAGQEAVDAKATSAQQLAWATKSISNQAGIAQVVGDLDRYLAIAVDSEGVFLARGQVTTLPSAQAFDTPPAQRAQRGLHGGDDHIALVEVSDALVVEPLNR